MESVNEIEAGEKWPSILEHYKKCGGVLVVLGAVDTGKSSFARWTANKLLKFGKTPAIVDCDVGQSDIGPPAVIGMAIVENPFSRYDELSLGGMYFVGGVQPGGRLLQCLTGALRMVEEACKRGATHIIVNTTGWIDGAGIYYKQSKIDAIRPAILVAIEQRKELTLIVAAYKRMNSIRTFFLPPSASIRKREREERRERRRENFERYFQDSSITVFSTNRIGISGINFPLMPERIKRQVIALIDGSGEHMALGIVQAYNTKKRILEVTSPFKSNPNLIRRLHFENFRLTDNDSGTSNVI